MFLSGKVTTQCSGVHMTPIPHTASTRFTASSLTATTTKKAPAAQCESCCTMLLHISLREKTQMTISYLCKKNTLMTNSPDPSMPAAWNETPTTHSSDHRSRGNTYAELSRPSPKMKTSMPNSSDHRSGRSRRSRCTLQHANDQRFLSRAIVDHLHRVN